MLDQLWPVLDSMEFEGSHNHGLTRITLNQDRRIHLTVHILTKLGIQESLKWGFQFQKSCQVKFCLRQIVAFHSFSTFTELLLAVDSGEQTLECHLYVELQFTE